MCSCFIEFIIFCWRKVMKSEACREFHNFFALSLINSIIQEHECNFTFII